MLLAALALTTIALPDSEPKANVRLDTGRHQVIVTAGPFTVSAMPPGMNHEDMEMMDDHNSPVYRFEWPVEGWLRGFAVELVDGSGKPIEPPKPVPQLGTPTPEPLPAPDRGSSSGSAPAGSAKLQPAP